MRSRGRGSTSLLSSFFLYPVGAAWPGGRWFFRRPFLHLHDLDATKCRVHLSRPMWENRAVHQEVELGLLMSLVQVVARVDRDVEYKACRWMQ
jgi:hypothetical protein